MCCVGMRHANYKMTTRDQPVTNTGHINPRGPLSVSNPFWWSQISHAGWYNHWQCFHNTHVNTNYTYLVTDVWNILVRKLLDHIVKMTWVDLGSIPCKQFNFQETFSSKTNGIYMSCICKQFKHFHLTCGCHLVVEGGRVCIDDHKICRLELLSRTDCKLQTIQRATASFLTIVYPSLASFSRLSYSLGFVIH